MRKLSSFLILVILLCLSVFADDKDIKSPILKTREKIKRYSIQDKIYSNAKANIGDKSWAYGVRRQAKRNPNVVYEKDVWKCNLFVYEIIYVSGLDIGTYECESGSGVTPPLAGDWYYYYSYLITNNADKIGEGLEGINKAIPGDIITDGIHMGIYAGNNDVINAGRYEVQITNLKSGIWGNGHGSGYGNNPFRIFRIKTNNQPNSTNNMVSISSEDNQNIECDRCHCNIMDNYYTPDNENISDDNLNNGTDSENGKPKDEDSGTNNLKQLSFFSIFMIFTSILIWQTHTIF